jgi:predicted nucleotidyltransferase
VITLTALQIDDLRELQRICTELNAELVLIGAIAYQHNFPGENRQTADIDSAVALDLDDFAKLERALENAGWSRKPSREDRWRSPRGTPLDLIPAGKQLRQAGQLTWPKSQFTMSLVGFNHVFSDAQPVELADHLTVKVIPALVLMLLKIVAYMDDQNRRAKDLSDIRSMLKLYEADSDRIYSDAVLDAALSDISLANAFLLGLDLRSLCAPDELMVVQRFLALVGDQTKSAWTAFQTAAPHYGQRNEDAARTDLAAFKQGLDRGGAGRSEKQR